MRSLASSSLARFVVRNVADNVYIDNRKVALDYPKKVVSSRAGFLRFLPYFTLVLEENGKILDSHPQERGALVRTNPPKQERDTLSDEPPER